MRRLAVILLAGALFGVFAESAFARGGSYTVTSGTARQQATVRAALDASAFDWGLIPRPVTIHVGTYSGSYSVPGEVFVDASILDAGRYSWGVVQHEMAHQVDFFLLDDAKRAVLLQRLGGKDWCYGVSGLAHADHGCERFASELAWAYWPSPTNAMRPAATGGESAGMPVADFRALVAELLGTPSIADVPPAAKAFAPTPKKRR